MFLYNKSDNTLEEAKMDPREVRSFEDKRAEELLKLYPKVLVEYVEEKPKKKKDKKK